MILLADANTLIDLGHVGGLEVLSRIDKTEVLDIILEECDDDRQPDLIAEIKSCGIETITTEPNWFDDINNLKSSSSGSLSFQDSANLYYAKEYTRTLLTGDKPLRKICSKENVKCHGSLWIVEQAFENNIFNSEELCNWLDEWPKIGSRLPEGELQKLKSKLNCN